MSLHTSVFLSVLCVSAVNISLAGQLNPPAGPIAPTPGPEPRIVINATNTPGDADSLFKITQAGSYYLTGNITGVAAKHGIEIAVGGVTIDMMGFELRGVAGSLDGITNIGLNNGNVAVRNGAVCGWGGDGVDLTATGGSGANVSDVFACDNGVVGIIGTFFSTITRCVVQNNGSHGIDCRTGAVIASCIASNNGGDGISADGSASVADCSAYENGGDGVSASDSSVVARCTAYNNAASGITLNTTGSATDCVVQTNGGHGISTNDGCTIVSCAARFNTLDGIRVTDDCIVRDNACTNNGAASGSGAGVHAVGLGNRIEGNRCANADIGIDVDSADNFIARNTCGGNTTNWAIAAGNACLVVVVTPNVAFSGDSGGTSPGSTNPNANFTD